MPSKKCLKVKHEVNQSTSFGPPEMFEGGFHQELRFVNEIPKINLKLPRIKRKRNRVT